MLAVLGYIVPEFYRFPGMGELASYASITEKAFEQAKALLADDGWSVVKNEKGATLSERSLPDEPIKAFKVEGTINRPPKECADKLWLFKEPEWQQMDSDVEEFSVIEEHGKMRLVHQINKVPWPLWKRDVAALWQCLAVDDTFYFIATSIEHPKLPEQKDKYVRAKLTFSLIVFTPAGDKTKIIRIIHVNPAGNIPASFVNASAAKMLQIPSKMEAIFAEK